MGINGNFLCFFITFSNYKTILTYEDYEKKFTFDPKSSKLVIGGSNIQILSTGNLTR